MELKMIKKTSEVLLEELELRKNDYDECEVSTLEDVVGHDYYLKDRDNVYVLVEDGLLVIPFDTVVDNEHLIAYNILCLSISYLAKNEVDRVTSIIQEREAVLNLLKSHI